MRTIFILQGEQGLERAFISHGQGFLLDLSVLPVLQILEMKVPFLLSGAL